MALERSDHLKVENIPQSAEGNAQSHHRPSKRLQAANRRGHFRRNLIAYLFLLPAIACFVIFSVLPILSALALSFQHYQLGDPPTTTWVGLQNFETIFRDPHFRVIWINSIAYLLWSMPAFVLPIFMAIAINEMRWYWGDVFRFFYYLPAILPPIMTYYLWEWLYGPENGLLNTILRTVGVPGLTWLDGETTAIPSLVIIGIWAGTGGGMLFYLAILQSIPSELYDAAEMDGAGIWRRMWFITLPQLRTIIMYMLLFSLMGAFQVFESPFVLTGGGPAGASTTPVLLVYRYAFSYIDFGAANALSLIIFAVLVVFSIIYLRIMRRVTGLGRL